MFDVDWDLFYLSVEEFYYANGEQNIRKRG